MERALSAPGKLFLAGEYAVLWGGLARVVAVGPRTHALVRSRADGEVRLVLEAGVLRGRPTPKGVRWERAVPQAFAFAAHTLDEALRAHGRVTLGFELALSPGALGPGGQKLGLGGSACAAVLTAEGARWVLSERYDALKLALVAHALVQEGKGSGGDVATCFAGGLVRYRRYDVGALAAASATEGYRAALAASAAVDVWRLSAPRVALGYAFSGESASTRLLIGQVEARLAPGGRAAFAARSDALGQAIEEGLAGGDFRALAEAVAAQQALLAELGPLETQGMRRVRALAAAYGCAAKQSGAGGGDGCILLAPDAERLSDLLEGLGARGYTALALTVEAGVRGEPAAHAQLRGWLDAQA